jgi:cytoskeletal protein CcmA (bactofilin family)
MSTDRVGSKGSENKPVAKAANGAHPVAEDATEWVRSAYPARRTAAKSGTDGAVRSTPGLKAPDGDLMACAGVKLKGEIASCDTLMVEGEVEAQLKSRQLVVAQGGGFIGRAEVEDAEIAGRFEGTLHATGKLIIRRTGRLNGQVSYGQLEIEPGGELRGRVDVQFGTKKLGILRASEKTWSWMP